MQHLAQTQKPNSKEVHNSSSQVHKTTISRELQLFDNCFQEHPQVSKLSSNYMDNISKQLTTDRTTTKQVMILSCWDISFDQRSSQSHYSYIIGSYEYLSTKRPTTKQRTKQSIMQKSPNESTNVQLVTSDIKTATTSETDDIKMQNSDMNISATAKLTSAKTLFYSYTASAVTYKWISDRFQTA